jgi:uncharacterized cupin superfamily protein
MMESTKHKHVFDPANVTGIEGAPYPAPLEEPLRGRTLRRLGSVAKLQKLAASLVELEPGAWLAQRLWQTHEDEFYYVLEGEATLVSDDGEEPMPAGTCVGFPAGVPNAHHIVNRSNRVVRFLDIANTADGVNTTFYPDVDMKAVWREAGRVFLRTNGDAY